MKSYFIVRLHCLSALTPFGTILIYGIDGVDTGLHCLSALTPFGTSKIINYNYSATKSPLPIGTYPFRDSWSLKPSIGADGKSEIFG